MSEVENFYNQPIVLDNGSGNIRCGFSTDEQPRVSYSNLIGKPKYNKIDYLPSDINIDDSFVGNQAQLRRGLLKLTYPIDHGIINDWDSLELIWQQVLLHDLIDNNSKNKLLLKEHSMLITEQPFTTRRQRDKICELLFETFDLGAINFAIPSILSLYSTGKTTGVSIDIGDGVCSIAPIFDGFTLPNSIKRINIGGRDVTKQLQIEIMKEGYCLNSSSEFEIVRNLKERLGFINLDNYNNSNILNNEEFEKFKLPDGKFLKISKKSLSKSCEILFNPEIYGFEYESLSNVLYDSIINTEIDLRGQFFENIILSGGCTMIRNFGSKLINDLRSIDNEVKIKIFASPDRKNNTFIGGSILSSLSTFNNIVVSKKQYLENPSIIHNTLF